MSSKEQDEWTTVSTKKTKKKRSEAKKNASRRGRGDRNASATLSTCRGWATSSASSSSLWQDDTAIDVDPSSAEGKVCMEQAERALSVCMNALEKHAYVQNMIQLLLEEHALETHETDATRNNDSSSPKTNYRYGEIVCYGIGNFVQSSQSVTYSAPMLQLGLALVIRQALAKSWSTDSNERDSDSKFRDEQSKVTMRYFEPLMTKVERVLLSELYHVDIIESNERGRRSVDSSVFTRTLFFMPHCPMRLYSNVLWSNWDPDILADGKIVIFGNSFRAYDDRLLTSEERTDPTNAVLRILPHLVAKSIDDLCAATEEHSLANMERAFNDSLLMSFARKASESSTSDWPERPEEYRHDKSNLSGRDKEVL